MCIRDRNKWRGARYGLDALVITSRDTDERWVTDELDDMLVELRPIAEELDCVDEIEIVREIMERGAGYQRQRKIYQATGDWKRVVDATCDEMFAMQPPR